MYPRFFLLFFNFLQISSRSESAMLDLPRPEYSNLPRLYGESDALGRKIWHIHAWIYTMDVKIICLLLLLKHDCSQSPKSCLKVRNQNGIRPLIFCKCNGRAVALKQTRNWLGMWLRYDGYELIKIISMLILYFFQLWTIFTSVWRFKSRHVRVLVIS